MQVSDIPVGQYKKVILFLRNGERVRVNNGRVSRKNGSKYFKCWKPKDRELKGKRSSAVKSFAPGTKVIRCEIKRRKNK
jgi:hypothetical protein